MNIYLDISIKIKPGRRNTNKRSFPFPSISLSRALSVKYLMTRQNADVYFLWKASFKIKRGSSGLLIWFSIPISQGNLGLSDCFFPSIVIARFYFSSSSLYLPQSSSYFLSTLQRTVKRALRAYQSLLFHNKETIAKLEELSKEN